MWKYRSIAVVGAGPGVGASTIATNLARYIEEVLGRTVCFTECLSTWGGDCLSYDRYAIEERLSPDGFDDVYSQILEERPISCNNWVGKINWRLRKPDRAGEHDAEEDRIRGAYWRLFSSARGDFLVFDIEPGDLFFDFLKDVDLVVAVLDPLPSRVLGQLDNIAKLRGLREEGKELVWVVNKMNEGVSKRQVKSLLRGERIIFFEAIDSSIVYSEEFRCNYLWDNPRLKGKFRELFTKISH